MATEKPVLLVLICLSPDGLKAIQAEYDVIYEMDPAKRTQVIEANATRVDAVLTNGVVGLTAGEMQRMSRLKLVCTLGAGYDKLDTVYGHAHGIAMACGAGTNASCVADHAMALLLAVVRQVVKLDNACRNGKLGKKRAIPANVSGKKMGIIGLGAIGRLIAQRAQAFEMEIGYHNRHKCSDVDFFYFDDVLSLAQWADYLIISAPGGASTHHMVDATVLKALGPSGFLVNVGRGSIVDSQALQHALKHQIIAGAALDVYESEPQPPADLIGFDTLVITPHIAGQSPEAIRSAENRFIENARCFFAGKPMPSPIY